MMINTKCLRCLFKEKFRKAQSSRLSTIQAEKQVVAHVSSYSDAESSVLPKETYKPPVSPLNRRLRFLRVVLPKIMVQSHRGTYTIPVRADVAANRNATSSSATILLLNFLIH